MEKTDQNPQQDTVVSDPADPEGTCLNCGTPLSGDYCSGCGQASRTARLSFRVFADNFVYGLTNLDRGLLHTVAMLFTRPGRVIRDYIEGRRVAYTKPFSMLVILCGVYGLTALALSYFWPIRDELHESMQVLFGESGFGFNETIVDWLSQNFLFWALLMLPGYAVLTQLLFRKSGYNFMEMLYMSAFFICLIMVVNVVSLPFRFFFFRDSFNSYTVLLNGLSIFLLAWCYKGLFDIGWWKALWKSVAVQVLFFIGMLVLMLLYLFF